MARWLHLEASPRGPRSRSRAVAERLLAGLAGAEIERLALFDATFPRFDGPVIEGRYQRIAGEVVAPEVEAEWATLDAMAREFLAHDGWVFSVPMWNFGVPWPLKRYIDCVTQPGLAFTATADGVTGHAAGKTAVLVVSGALDVSADGPLAALDFQLAYLRAWLGFIGVTDIHTIAIRPTFGAPDAVAHGACLPH